MYIQKGREQRENMVMERRFGIESRHMILYQCASFASIERKKLATPCLPILLDDDIGNYDDDEYCALV